MANEQNLKPFTKNQSREKAVKNGSAGGKASGKVRRQKRTMRTALTYLMKLPISDADNKLKQSMAQVGVDEGHMDYATVMAFSLMRECIKGNVRAYEVIRDTIGEKPQDKVQVDGVSMKVEVPMNIKQLSLEELRSIAAAENTAPSTEEFTDEGDGEQ